MRRLSSPANFGVVLTLCLISCLPANAPSGPQQGQERRNGTLSQSAQDPRLRRVAIYSGDVTLHLGLKANLLAIAFDEKGEPIPGVLFRWTANDGAGKPAPIESNGMFEARVPGVFRVTATGGGKSATVGITVPAEPISTGTAGNDSSSPKPQLCKAVVPVPAALPLAIPINVGSGAGFNAANTAAALSPGNRRFVQPNDALNRVHLPTERSSAVRKASMAIQTAGNSNFTFSTPVLSVPGRGSPPPLNLTYNSLVWTALSSSFSNVVFDIDADWPAPGFNITFGKLVNAGSLTAMFIDGNGGRHPFHATSATGSTTFMGYTTDGTLIDYYATFDANGNISSGVLNYPDGSTVAFNAIGANAVHATQITDRNGNYITIAYSSSQGAPAIAVVSDTVGRVYQFNYDSGGLLVGVTGPGLGGVTRELVHLTYQTLPQFQAILSGSTTGFASPLFISTQANIYYFLQSITYPSGTTSSSGYWFGDSNSYSAYGMITKVSEQVAMNLSGNNYTTQGTVNNFGVVRHETLYNYPTTPLPLKTLPSYTTATDTWANMDSAPAVTSYVVSETTSPRTVTVTTPDQITTVQNANNTPGTPYLDGLTTRIETHAGGSSGPLVAALDFTYEQGPRGNARLVNVRTTDERGQITQTTTTYTAGITYDQVAQTAELGYSGETLRTTSTGYSQDPGYSTNHIFNLPIEVDVRDGSFNLVSHTLYSYDAQRGTALVDAAPTGTQHLVGHLDTFNPFEPVQCGPPVCHNVCVTVNCIVTCHQVCVPGTCTGSYVPATDFRGNLSTVTSYSNAAAESGALTQTYNYDITGNIVSSVDTAGVPTTITYTSNTNFAYPESVGVGPIGTQVKVGAVYDLGSALQTSSTDANGQTTSFSYNSASLRLTSAQRSTGAHSDFVYVDGLFAINKTVYLSSGTSAMASESVVIQNGLGLTKSVQALAEPQGNGLFDFVETQFDAMGRISGQSLPYRATTRQTSGLSMMTVTYDFAGRGITQTAADGVSVSHTCYNEYSCYKVESSPSTSPGQTVRTEDSWGRQSWTRSDALGRLVEAVEPNPAGPTGSVSDPGALHTSYSYDALDNLIQSTQGSQVRTFAYDSLGRLVAQKLAERNATLSYTQTPTPSGAFVGTGTYSDVFIYSPSSGNLVTRIDARGVRVTYNYENGILNRLLGVTFDLTGVGDTAQSVAPTANVTYTYEPSGDLTRLASASATGTATEAYGYDGFGRLSAVTVTLSARPSFPMETDFGFDTVDRLTSLTYPVPYGYGVSRRGVATPVGVDGRPKQVLVDGAVHANNIMYSPSGGLTSLTVGLASQYQGAETYTYEPTSGLLSSQLVQAGGATLLNLSYSYTAPKLGATSGNYRTGQLVSVSNAVNSAEGRAYGYDALRRLVSASGGSSITAPQWTQKYAYDRYGNRLSVTANGTAAGTGGAIPVDGLGSVGFGADSSSNRITDAGWIYDDEGNLLRGRVGASTWEQFEYDAANRLVAVCQDGGVDSSGKLLKTCTAAGGTTAATLVETYTYGVGRDRLVVQNGPDANVRRYYARANSAVIMEYTESDSAPTSLQYAQSSVFLSNRLLSTATPQGASESWQFYHADRLGTRLIVTGATAKEQATLPFGVDLSAETNATTNYRFTTYDRNVTTALDYAMNRYYGVAQGRFTQVDPLGALVSSPGDPQSFNQYAYARNDPLNKTDPSGLLWATPYCLQDAITESDDGGDNHWAWVQCGASFWIDLTPSTDANKPNSPGSGGGKGPNDPQKKDCTAANPGKGGLLYNNDNWQGHDAQENALQTAYEKLASWQPIHDWFTSNWGSDPFNEIIPVHYQSKSQFWAALGKTANASTSLYDGSMTFYQAVFDASIPNVAVASALMNELNNHAAGLAGPYVDANPSDPKSSEKASQLAADAVFQNCK